jgi:hypothetical protein
LKTWTPMRVSVVGQVTEVVRGGNLSRSDGDGGSSWSRQNRR